MGSGLLCEAIGQIVEQPVRAPHLERFRTEAGLPVLASVQVAAWHALELAGLAEDAERLRIPSRKPA
jgi:hypothetical protein